MLWVSCNPPCVHLDTWWLRKYVNVASYGPWELRSVYGAREARNLLGEFPGLKVRRMERFQRKKKEERRTKNMKEKKKKGRKRREEKEREMLLIQVVVVSLILKRISYRFEGVDIWFMK